MQQHKTKPTEPGSSQEDFTCLVHRLISTTSESVLAPRLFLFRVLPGQFDDGGCHILIPDINNHQDSKQQSTQTTFWLQPWCVLSCDRDSSRASLLFAFAGVTIISQTSCLTAVVRSLHLSREQVIFFSLRTSSKVRNTWLIRLCSWM